MTNTVSTALTFLYETLTGDTTFMSYVTGVYTGLAPVSAQPDFAIIVPQAMPKTLSANAVVVLSRPLFQVKLVGPRADYTNLSSAYDRALSLIGLVRSTAGILSCYITSDLYVQETVAGDPWVNLGGLFRVEV
jgi:hypothetical protein